MSSSTSNNVSKPNREQINAFRTDMFGRTKISEAFTMFDSAHRYQDNGDYSDTHATNGTSTYDINQSSALLNVTNASGSETTRESKRVFPYQPGKSLQILQTFVFAPAKTNLRQRAGYFTRQNGFYLEQDGTSISFVKRTSISGQMVETRIPQSEWNMDKLDGSGPSDVVLDLSKAQILFTEIEWLGVGSARMGFAIDGYFIIAHQFNHANRIDSVYMTTASLPVRYEITNTGATSGSSTLKQICTTVISNGGYFKPTELWTAVRQSASFTTSYYPLISVRLAPGREDAVVIPDVIDISPNSAGDFEFALVRNPTTLTGGTWVTHSPKNNVEYNVGGTAITGGTIISQGYFATTNQNTASASITDSKNFAYQLGRTNADSPVSDVISLVIRTTSGNASAKSSFGWFDLL